jgi:hypothetical protein
VFHLIGHPAGAGTVVGIDGVALGPAAVYAEAFSRVELPGPFSSASGLVVGDVDGDGTLDVVVSDAAGRGSLVVFNGDGAGGFTRDELDLSSFGGSPVGLATGPMTAGDAVADVAVILAGSSAALTPLASANAQPFDQAPRLRPVAGISGVEGQALAISAVFSDADLGDGHTAEVDWGDGVVRPATVVQANGQWTVQASHAFADNGIYRVRVSVTDRAGARDYQELVATVANAAPRVTAASRLSGNLAPTSSFKLAGDNKKPSGIVTNGQFLWVTDEKANQSKIFVYSLAGVSQGSWRLDPANQAPAG